MPRLENEATAKALDDLLDEERAALIRGDLEHLASLLTPKEALIEALNAVDDPTLSGLRQLGEKVRRNQLLLDGALEGIRSVSKRLAELNEVKGTLETYGADGVKREITAMPEGSVERRA